MASSDLGLDKMKELLGEENANLAYQTLAEFDPGFAQIIVNTCFGDVWCRAGLSKRERSIVTIATLASMGRAAELRGHIGIGLRNGLTPDEIKEIVIHISQYAGIPAAVEAMTAYKAIIQ